MAVSSSYNRNWTLISYLQKCKSCFYFVTGVALFYIVLSIAELNHGVLKHIQHFANTASKPKDDLACSIAKLDPFDSLIIDAVLNDEDQEKLEKLNCEESYPMLFSSSIDLQPPRLIPLISKKEFRKNYTISSCCYRTIQRGNPKKPSTFPDHAFKLSAKCRPVSLDKPTVVPIGHEFISIECQHKKPIVKLDSNDKTPLSSPLSSVTIVDMHAFVHNPLPSLSSSPSSSSEKPAGNGSDRTNILVIGLDAMARMNFIRRFPKSFIFLKKTLRALEMEMYNKIGDNSLPNLGPLLTNQKVLGEINLTCEINQAYDNCPFIWDHFSELGYHTLLAEDDRRLGIFDYLKNGFSKPPTNYYFRTFNSAADKHIASQRLLFAKICYGPRFSFQVMLDYVRKVVFAMNSVKENFFQFTWSSSLTHDFLSGGVIGDKLLYSFLKWLHEGGYLNNTILLVLGDHGARWGPIRSYYQGQLEERLPAMYFVMPPWFQEKYARAYTNLMTNQKRLVTVWDLHQTLLDLSDMEKSIGEDVLLDREKDMLSREQSFENPGISMFLPISPQRTCEMAGIPDSYCTCNHHMLPANISDPEVQLAADFAVDYINEALQSSDFEQCALLSLSEIKSAGKVSFGESKIWQGYQLNIETEPGGGWFEALVVHDEMKLADRNWTIAGRVLRTNLYGNQSWCVDDKQAKLYCFCNELQS